MTRPNFNHPHLVVHVLKRNADGKGHWREVDDGRPAWMTLATGKKQRRTALSRWVAAHGIEGELYRLFEPVPGVIQMGRDGQFRHAEIFDNAPLFNWRAGSMVGWIVHCESCGRTGADCETRVSEWADDVLRCRCGHAVTWRREAAAHA